MNKLIVKNDKVKKVKECTRVEVIDQKGRTYVNWDKNNIVSISLQDDGKTIKIFIKTK
jgi:hypothetical protein